MCATDVLGSYNVAGSGSTSAVGGMVSFLATVTSVGPMLTVGAPSSGGTAYFLRGFTTVTLSLTSGGTLTGPGNITVTGTFTWNNATLSGTGSLTVAKSAVMNIGGNNQENLDTRTLNNGGQATWGGLGNIVFYNGAVFNNEATGTFLVTTNQPINGTGAFNNLGNFKVLSPAVPTTINVAFNNSKTVSVASGELDLGGEVTGSGSFSLSSRTLLKILGAAIASAR